MCTTISANLRVAAAGLGGVGVEVQAEVTCAKPETAAGLECHRPSLELCQATSAGN